MNSIILVVIPHQLEMNTTAGCVSLTLIMLVIVGYYLYSIVKHDNF
jgi:hypothetical protein